MIAEAGCLGRHLCRDLRATIGCEINGELKAPPEMVDTIANSSRGPTRARPDLHGTS